MAFLNLIFFLNLAYIDLTDYLIKNQADSELPTIDELMKGDCFVEGVDNLEEFYNMVINNPIVYNDELNLLKGSKLIKLLRNLILEKTEFQCSAGKFKVILILFDL